MVPRTRVDIAAKEFLTQLSTKKVSRKVREGYKFILEELTGEFFGNNSPLIEKVTTEDIALYFNYLQGCQFKFDPYRQHRIPPTLEPARFEQAKKELYTFWKWAADNYGFSNPFIPRNIADDSRRIPSLSVDEIRRLIHVTEEINAPKINRICASERRYLKDNIIVLLLIDTGIRAEELSRLIVKEVDFKENIITIHDAYENERKIPMGKKLAQLLLRYIIRYFLEKSRDDELLIPGGDGGEPIDRKTVHNLITKLGKEAGIENIYALRFRASFAKYYEEVCMFDENVMQYMGLLNKRHLRLYIDEMKYKTPNPDKRFSIMDTWGI